MVQPNFMDSVPSNVRKIEEETFGHFLRHVKFEDVCKDETVYTFVYFMKVLYSILLLQQVLEARAKKNQGEMAAYSQYQAHIGGKIVPDSFAYNSRKNPEELYIKVPKEKWEELKGDGQNLINKQINNTQMIMEMARKSEEWSFIGKNQNSSIPSHGSP